MELKLTGWVMLSYCRGELMDRRAQVPREKLSLSQSNRCLWGQISLHTLHSSSSLISPFLYSLYLHLTGLFKNLFIFPFCLQQSHSISLTFFCPFQCHKHAHTDTHTLTHSTQSAIQSLGHFSRLGTCVEIHDHERNSCILWNKTQFNEIAWRSRSLPEEKRREEKRREEKRREEKRREEKRREEKRREEKRREEKRREEKRREVHTHFL